MYDKNGLRPNLRRRKAATSEVWQTLRHIEGSYEALSKHQEVWRVTQETSGFASKESHKDVNRGNSATDSGGQKSLIVGDSSYIVEALLENQSLLADEQIVTPDVAVYEVANAVWKRENLLKNLENGLQYIVIFFGFIESGKIAILPSNENLLQASYKIAKRNSITLYDAVFIALALEFGLPLKTFDKAQIRAFNSESHDKTS